MATNTMVNGFDPATAAALPPRTRELVDRRDRLLGPAYRLFYDRPVEVVRGEGVHLYGPNGEVYLDAYNNVPSVGHSNPRVVDAITRQAQTLNTNTRYLTGAILDYAERLLATHAGPLDRVMFTCTGSEANDLALRIARQATGAEGVVVTANAYHGVTAAVAELSPSLGAGVNLGPSVRAVAPPSPEDGDATATGEAFAQRVAAAIDDLRRHGIRTAAVLMDTIFSSDGVIPGPVGFLQPVVEVTHRFDALFIADEVQAGFGRTGDAMWGYARHGIEPDMATMGKPMGNGMPVAAVAARSDLLESFGARSRYFNTFGGNSVAIAAAAAVLDVIESEHLVEHSASVGDHLRQSVTQLAGRYPVMRSVRGAGLYVAADLVRDDGTPDPVLAGRVVNGLRDRDVLISATGPTGSALKIRPPLPFAVEDADGLIAALDEVLSGLATAPLPATP